ncbi:MAG: PrsW family glutamic-type intramembrane protease, partial [Halobacteria archaeon]|nr:PrsW family glutamic-type intramembrane protease [Halobacteria archaeon]
LIEEVAKSVAVYAGFAKSLFERTTRNALVLGALSGAGFFLGEKITVVVRVVGIPELRLGRAAFGAGGPGVMNASPIVLVGLLMAPLALHVVTASISAVGIRYGKREYVVALVGAVALHTAYNLTVVGLLG